METNDEAKKREVLNDFSAQAFSCSDLMCAQIKLNESMKSRAMSVCVSASVLRDGTKQHA